jgi:hypothetical protein
MPLPGSNALTLATMRIEVETRLAEVSRDMKTLERRVGKATKEVNRGMNRIRNATARAGKAFRGLKAAAVSLVAAGGLSLLVKRSLDFADSIDKVSRRLGISVEALQEFRFVAQIAGVSTRTLDMGLQRFTRRLSEAQNGTGEALEALRELSRILGVDLINSGMNTEQTFVQLAGAFAKIEDGGDRARLAMRLFDSEGVSFLQFLGDGIAAMEAMREQAREMGLVLGRDTVASAVKAKDQLTILGTYMQTRLAAIVGENAEGIIALTKAILDLADAAGKAFGAFQSRENQPTNLLVRDFARLNAEIFNRQKRIRGLREELRQAESTGFPFGSINAAKARNDLRQAEEAQLKSVREQADLAGILRGRGPRGAAAPDGGGTGTDIASQKADELQRNLLKERLRLEGRFIDLVKVEFNEKLKLINATIQDKEERARAADNLEAIVGRQIQLAQAAQQEFEESRKKQEGLWIALGETIESTFSRALSAMIVEGESSFKELKDAFVREFLEAAMQELVTSPLLNVLLGDRLASGKRSGGIIKSIGSAILSTLPKFAEGGCPAVVRK